MKKLSQILPEIWETLGRLRREVRIKMVRTHRSSCAFSKMTQRDLEKPLSLLSLGKSYLTYYSCPPCGGLCARFKELAEAKLSRRS